MFSRTFTRITRKTSFTNTIQFINEKIILQQKKLEADAIVPAETSKCNTCSLFRWMENIICSNFPFSLISVTYNIDKLSPKTLLLGYFYNFNLLFAALKIIYVSSFTVSFSVFFCRECHTVTNYSVSTMAN